MNQQVNPLAYSFNSTYLPPPVFKLVSPESNLPKATPAAGAKTLTLFMAPLPFAEVISNP